MAVRFRELRQDRPYDVVGEINISEPMGGEEAAMADLRRRGRELRADLIMNISFEHGDGAGATHVTGTAIRYR
jgi:hypothetical protein